MTHKSWMDELIARKGLSKGVAREAALLEIASVFDLIMEENGINKTTMAEKLGVTKSLVTQVLSGNRNLTVRTMSDFAFALGGNIRFSFIPAMQDIEYSYATTFAKPIHTSIQPEVPFPKRHKSEYLRRKISGIAA